MVLSNLIFPTSESENHSLYYRVRNGSVHLTEKGLFMEKGTILRLDTYFNAFFYDRYREYTTIDSLYSHLNTDGKVTAQLFCRALDRSEELVLTETVEAEQTVQVKIGAFPTNGMLYWVIRAECDCHLLDGGFSADSTERNRVKVAAVICTYHREKYVFQNLRRLEQGIWQKKNCPVQNDLDVIIVDNGNSLETVNNNHVTVFPNKNYGGSGGFTRGMLEALRCGERYSHVLLMDDDISFEPEILIRTIQLLKVAKSLEKPLIVGGQMLVEEEPATQLVGGNRYRGGRPVGLNENRNLADVGQLLLNTVERHADFNAWWYCCIPLETIREKGCSMPFFIKTDDAEFGLRANANVLLLNGIGVWHMDFRTKYSPHLEYYIKRNELITNAIHHRSDGVGHALWRIILAGGKAILKEEPGTVGFLLLAYQDFLQGPEFFLNIKEDELNAELIRLKKVYSDKKRVSSLLAFPFQILTLWIQLGKRYRTVQELYIREQKRLTSPDYWCEHLGITGLNS